MEKRDEFDKKVVEMKKIVSVDLLIEKKKELENYIEDNFLEDGKSELEQECLRETLV